MVIKLYGGILFRVSAVFPSSTEQLSTPNYFALSIIDNDKELFGDLRKFILDEKYPERKQLEAKLMEEKQKEEEKKKQEEEEKAKQLAKKSKKKKRIEQEIVEGSKPCQPFIQLQLLEPESLAIGKNLEFKNELYLKSDADYVVSIGKSNENKYSIQNDYISSFHCQIVYKAQYSGWFIQEMYNGPGFKCQETLSNGSFIYLKSWTEMMKKTQSVGQKLENGMILDLMGHQFQIDI